MKTTLSIFLNCFFCLHTTAFAQSISNQNLQVSSPELISIGQSFQIGNGKSGDRLEVNVYLPDSYHGNQVSQDTGSENQLKRYPVLYVVDGGKQQDFKKISGLGALASINPYIFE